MRESLVTQIRGVGWKVASHFLRNIGIGLDHGLALLDSHIQRELAKFGYIADVVDHNLSKTKYLDYERRPEIGSFLELLLTTAFDPQ